MPPISPNTAPASHDWSASHMKSHLECAEQAKSTSNLTKYCACHAKWISWLIRAAYETSFPMRRASKVNLQPQQILRLPRKRNPMINPRHTWNVLYNARSMHSQPPTSPNTAPATKSVSSRLQRKLRELLLPIERWFDDNPTIIRRQSDQKIASRTRRFGDLTRPTLNTILYWKIQHFALRLSPKMSPNAAPATKSHTPTSPNTAPATQNASHDWSASHMKRHFQCAEQAKSTSNLSKYCPCHAKWISWLIRVTYWNVIYNARSKHSQPPTSPNTAPATKSVSSRLQRKLRELLPPIERRFDDNPTIIRSENRISHLPLRRPYSSDLEHDFVLKNTTFRAPAISQNVTKCCACHEKSHSNFTKYCAWHEKCISWLIRVSYETSFPMRRASKVNLQPQQILPLPRKMNLMIDPRHILKRHLQCAEQAQWASNLTKYCACHEICKFKTSAETPWIASANRKTIRRQSDDNPIRKSHLAPAASETLLVRPRTRFCIEKYNISRSGYLPKCHQMLRLPRKVTLQLHQILRLARKMHSTLLYSILSWHLFSLGIYSLLASILSRHLFSLGIYSL